MIRSKSKTINQKQVTNLLSSPSQRWGPEDFYESARKILTMLLPMRAAFTWSWSYGTCWSVVCGAHCYRVAYWQRMDNQRIIGKKQQPELQVDGTPVGLRVDLLLSFTRTSTDRWHPIHWTSMDEDPLLLGFSSCLKSTHDAFCARTTKNAEPTIYGQTHPLCSLQTHLHIYIFSYYYYDGHCRLRGESTGQFHSLWRMRERTFATWHVHSEAASHNKNADERFWWANRSSTWETISFIHWRFRFLCLKCCL